MQEITLTLPMLPDMELTASKTACAMGEHIRMSPDKIDEMRMAVVEACINAFEHSKARDQKVKVIFTILGQHDDPQGIEITVRDEGIGFEPDSVAVPEIEEKLRAPRKRGWGLKIIHGLVDDVQIRSDPKGTTVVMRKMR
ncbi:MAG: ATP-binding protein [Acidobacteria bacterium]|nr:MAG: ATP-binding protein [Acidobacteriota bacterium]